MSTFDSVLLQEDSLIQIHHKQWLNRNISLIRLDLMHPEYGGNKWFKLKYNIKRAIAEKKDYVVSFGGAFSNHLYSMASICRDAGLKSVGVVRGEAHYANNAQLDFCRNEGMELLFLSKSDYNNRYSEPYTDMLNRKYNDPWIIPDGGENEEGIKGTSEISRYVPLDCTDLFVSCGTFTTLSGILAKLPPHIHVWAVPALRAESWALEAIKKNLEIAEASHTTLKRCHLLYDYHFGGFAKTNDNLDYFQNMTNQELGLNLDKVYGAKMFFALHDCITKDYFGCNTSIAVIMCGRPLTNTHTSS